MTRELPVKLTYFLKNALEDLDDGYEYASELNRILNSDDCQLTLKGKEIDALRDFAENVKKAVGEINYYSRERVKELEQEHFGGKGIMGYLGTAEESGKPVWPF
jgi:hypothetical protein